MGKAGNRSILKGLSGKVGPVSVTAGKHGGIVRIKPSRSKRKESEESNIQHLIFIMVGSFFHTLIRGFFKKGYRLKDKDTGSALSASKSYHMKNAVIGTYPNLSIDLSKLKFSDSSRPIENGWNAEFKRVGAKSLQISWEINLYREKTTHLDDEAIIIFYNLDTEGFNHREGIPRSDCSFTLATNASTRGSSMACWMFFVSADKKLVSDTLYLGIVEPITMLII